MKTVCVPSLLFEASIEKNQCPEIHGITTNSCQKRPISEFFLLTSRYAHPAFSLVIALTFSFLSSLLDIKGADVCHAH